MELSITDDMMYDVYLACQLAITACDNISRDKQQSLDFAWTLKNMSENIDVNVLNEFCLKYRECNQR